MTLAGELLVGALSLLISYVYFTIFVGLLIVTQESADISNV